MGRVLSFVAGALVTLAAVAIYAGPQRRHSPFPPEVEIDPDAFESAHKGRPRYREAVADAAALVGRHDPLCEYPRRPCLCVVMRPIHR